MDNYRFGFNGQEMDNEISGQTGTHTTAMFWEYDSRLGRRWNLDPKPQIGISDYACFGNNPIWFSDPLGDKFKTKRDERKAARLETSALARINLLNEKLKNSSLSDGQRTDINSQITELGNVANEVSEMRKAETLFTFKRIIAGEGAGLTTMDDYGTIIIRYSGIGLSSFAHEMKHGYQALKGELNFSNIYDKDHPGEHPGGSLYDATDEVGAYRRSYAFGDDRKFFSSYADITANKIINLSDKYYRYPYEHLSTSSLNINSYCLSYYHTKVREYYSKEVMRQIDEENAMLHKIIIKL